MATPKKTPAPTRPRPPKRVTTFRLDVDLYEWIEVNLHRSVTVSAFINDAVRQTIERLTSAQRR